jgi:hypothetical protein
MAMHCNCIVMTIISNSVQGSKNWKLGPDKRTLPVTLLNAAENAAAPQGMLDSSLVLSELVGS